MAAAATDGGDERCADVVQQEVLHGEVLLDDPLVRVEEHGVCERDDVGGEHADDVRDAGDRGACRVVDLLCFFLRCRFRFI